VKARTALVLGGGGARGAYEAGVIRYLRGPLARDLGAQPRVDLLCGTSIGAVNACFLAGLADEPAQQGEALADVWRALRLEEVYRFGAIGLAGLPGYVLRALRGRARGERRFADLVQPDALARVVERRVDWPRLHENVRAGRLDAVTVTATDLGSGRPVVFVEAAPGVAIPPLGGGLEGRPALLGPAHALASGALPLLFRPVALEGSWFTDGAVRMSVPLTPAVRLGAARVLVVALQHEDAGSAPALPAAQPPTTAAQLGRILSALLVDHTELDLERLRRTNALLARAERAFGPGVEERLAALAAEDGAEPVRRVEDLVIRPSVDLGALARDHAARRLGQLRRGSLAARLLRRAASQADAGEDGAADLASYLLFDRPYAEALLELGFEDARAAHGRLAAFFGGPGAAELARPARSA
jgi:NTE family protein